MLNWWYNTCPVCWELFDNIDQVTHHSDGYDISEYKVQKIVKDFDVSIFSAYMLNEVLNCGRF